MTEKAGRGESKPDYVPPEGARLHFEFDSDRSTILDAKRRWAKFRRFAVGDRGRYYLIAELDRRIPGLGLGHRLVAFRITGFVASGRYWADLFAVRAKTAPPAEDLSENSLKWLGQVSLEVETREG